MPYHAVTVTLENISGIVAAKDKYGSRTISLTFNATVAGKRQYAVVVRGDPRLENGMVVTAVLRDTENWQTLVGWLNHRTGEISGVDSPYKSFALCVFTVLLGVLFALKALNPASSAGFMTVLFCIVLSINAWSLLSWRKTVIVYKLLKP
jgi:hypothetical protein